MNATKRSADLDIDERGYPVHVDFGIKCGNHGRAKVYHSNIATVKWCFDFRRDLDAQQAAEIAAEQAIERHFENSGYDEARAQEDWEARNGVIDFSTAMAEAQEEYDRLNAEPATERHQPQEMWPWADGKRPGAKDFTTCSGRPPASSKVTQDGMYRNPETGEIFRVQVAVHGSGNLYAKRLVKLDTPKVKRGKEYSYEFEYFPGGLKTLRAEWLMTLAEAKEYGALYGCCIRCGRTLTKEESIERAMGDWCASKGNWA